MVFKSYDVRGVYPSDINEDFAKKFGIGVAKYFKNSDSIAVARDGRLSSKSLFESFCEGVNSQGKNIVNLGLVSTCAAYFAFANLKVPGVVITASHNPKEYNGFKVISDKLMPVDKESGLLEIKDLMNSKSSDLKGGIINFDLSLEYENFLKNFSSDSKLKIIVDQSNGSSHLECKFLKKYYGAKILNESIDGNFPGHEPDPFSPAAKENIKKEILKENADIGIIFDGDGDRSIFFDEKGEVIRPEIAMCFIANKGPILYDVRCSKSLSDVAKENSQKSIMMKAGRSFFIRNMRPNNAFYGVEGSGHYFFKEFFNFDSAIIMVLKILNKLETLSSKLSVAASNFNRYYHSSEINFKVENREQSIKKIKEEFKDCKVVEIDGVSLYGEDFWLNARKSNTEPLIRINAESNSKKGLDDLILKLKKLF